MTAKQKFLKAFPGVWLAILYVWLGIFVIFSLSAHQLQFKVSSLKGADQSKEVGAWELTKLYSDWEETTNSIASQNAELAGLKVELDKERKDDLSFQLQARNLDIECKRAFEDINKSLAYEIQDYAPREVIECEDSSFRFLSSKINQLIVRYAAKDGSEDLVNLLSTTKSHLEKYENFPSRLLEESIDFQTRFSSIDTKAKRVNEINSNLTLLESSLEKLLQDQKLGSHTGDFLVALSYLVDKEKFCILGESLCLLPKFSKMSLDMLTLLLVISMGGLGGTISLTRSYLNHKKQADEEQVSAAYYIFRPLLGGITALSVFILAKAGVLIISTPSQGIGGTTLSPFFISFIGIISGMLADSALDTIQRTGRNWFKNAQVMPDRWAFGLKDYLILDKDADEADQEVEIQKNIKTLSEILNVSEDVVQNWVSGSVQVPSREQVIISAFVRKPLRDIFSETKGSLDTSQIEFANQ